MAKTPKHITDRIKDEVHGVVPGGREAPVTFGERAGRGFKSEPLPEFNELDAPKVMVQHGIGQKPLKKAIEIDVAEHVELGRIEREVGKAKKVVTERLKYYFSEHLMVPGFYINANRVTVTPQRRRKFDEDLCKRLLKDAGVKVEVIKDCFAEATGYDEVPTLRVTPPGGEE